MNDSRDSRHRTAPPLTEDQRREIYELYFQKKRSVAEIATQLHSTRVTIHRHIKRLNDALHRIHPQHQGSSVTIGLHYARYADKVLKETEKLPGRWSHTADAKRYIRLWWQRQQRKAAHPLLFDGARLYHDYCQAVAKRKSTQPHSSPTSTTGKHQGEHVSWKTFQRLFKCILQDAYQPVVGRPGKKKRKHQSKREGNEDVV